MNAVLLTVLIGSNVTAAAPEATERPKEFQLIPVEQEIIAFTNAQRARHGLPELVVDPSLMRAARRHAAWMARRTVLQHTSAAVAENIAQGQNSAREALGSWMSSSGHRANILSSGHRRIGVAAYRGPNGQAYWCQQFLY